MARHTSLKSRITGFFLLVALIPLCIGYGLVVLYEYRAARIRRLDDARLQARTLGRTGLLFGESGVIRDAERLLAGLEAVPWVLEAVVLDPDGGELARYRRDEAPETPSVWPDETVGFNFQSGAVLVTETLQRNGRSWGRISLMADLNNLNPGILPFSFTMLVLLGGLVFLVFTLASLFQSKITRPLYGLLTATKSLAGTGDSEPGRKRRRDEFGVLRERLEYLLEQADIRAMNLEEKDRAEKKIRELEADREKYIRVFEQNPLGLMILEPLEDGTDFVFTDFNNAAEKATRMHRADLIGKRISAMFPAVVESGLFELLRRAATSDEDLYFPYSRHIGAEDEPWWEHIIWRFESGEVAAAFRDVSERKRMEEDSAAERERWTAEREEERREFEEKIAEVREVEPRSEREELINREMEGLFQVVSEEFTSPMQSIDEHSMALLKEYSASLNDDGKNDLLQLRAAQHRMLQLFNELKTLAEISRDEMKVEPVDLSALARRKSVALKEGNPERKLEFRIQDGLTVQGNARLLEMVIGHLFTNAWIYSGKNAPTTIEFGVEERGDGREFFVRDHGIGFSPKDAERIFRPFQKLNPEEVYPGTGMGLAMVRRIIIRHGGTVRAVSEPGQGSTFYFTLGNPSPKTGPPPAD